MEQWWSRPPFGSNAEQLRYMPDSPLAQGPEFLNHLDDGRTPLHIAAFNGDLGRVQDLIRAGADPLLREGPIAGANRLAKEWAELMGHDAVVRFLQNAERQALDEEDLDVRERSDANFLTARYDLRVYRMRCLRHGEDYSVDALAVQHYCGLVALRHQARRLRFDGGPAHRVALAYVQECTQGFDADARIGEGAFGIVYRGTDTAAAMRFAVKRLRPELDTAEHCHQREVDVMRSYVHPNLIRLYGYARGDGEWCLLLELARRGDLECNLQREEDVVDLTPRRRARVLAGIGRALSYLHRGREQPCFHRDVKSANVMLMFDFVPKLADCGLSKLIVDEPADPERTSWTNTAGGPFGTPAYMDPTYVRRGRYGEKNEIYSFGLVMLEVLTGKLQSHREIDLVSEFVEDGEDVLAHLDGRAGVWDPGLSQGVADVALSCLRPYRQRESTLVVAQRLRALETQFARPSAEEEGLAAELMRAREDLERIELERLEHERLEHQNAPARHRCGICFEEDLPASECVGCNASHWLCRACFTEHVRMQSQDEPRRIRARGARVRCPMPECAAEAYPDRTIAQNVDDAVFGLYIRNQHEFVQEQENAQDARVRHDALPFVRQHIQDRILTLRCPRCGQAFLDFDGCFALTCARCACGFCGYCLQDCGGDAHAHVRECAVGLRAVGNHANLFFPRHAGVFNQVHRQRRQQMLTHFLSQLAGNERAAALEDHALVALLREANLHTGEARNQQMRRR